MKQLALLGIDQPASQPVFNVPRPERADLIIDPDWPRPWIGVHPYAGYTWKHWPCMNDLLERLKSFPGTVIQMGRQANASVYPVGIDRINQLSIPELFWAIGQCDAFVTADSGPMHIAFAMNVPTVAMFSVMNPKYLVSQKNLSKHTILYKPTDLSESPVHVRYKKNLDNMKAITLDEVWDRLSKVIDL